MKNKQVFRVKEYAAAVFGAIICSLLMSLLIAVLVSKQVMAMDAGKIAAQIVSDLILFASCWVSVRKSTKGRLTTALILAALIAGIRLLVGVILFQNAPLKLQSCFLSLIAGAAAGLILGVKKKTR